MWCVAELDEEYVRKLQDVLELYERPYNQAEPVVCLDEKPVSLHKDVRSPKPSAPGQVAKRDSEYERCGTANVCSAPWNPKLAATTRGRPRIAGPPNSPRSWRSWRSTIPMRRQFTWS